jgi:hypothetical protein
MGGKDGRRTTNKRYEKGPAKGRRGGYLSVRPKRQEETGAEKQNNQPTLICIDISEGSGYELSIPVGERLKVDNHVTP